MSVASFPGDRRIPRVGVMVDVYGGVGRQIITGIGQFVRTGGPWLLCGDRRWAGAAIQPLDSIRQFRGDGLIGQFSHPQLVEDVKSLGIPVVNVASQLLQTGLPTIHADNQAIGRMAAEYFLGKGFSRYATVGPRDHQYSKDRCGTFAEIVSQAGYECPHFFVESWSGFADEQAERRQFEALCDWARQLVAPTAVFCCNDLTTRDVMAACEAVGRKVPEQIALLGVDNDELICELSTTPLSSIDACGQRVGFEAATLLAAMMRGQPPPAGRLLITPAGVVTRRSSDILAVGDPEVASAMRFIHDRTDCDLSVENVVIHATCSRRSLERRFRAAIGRSINQEIQRCRLERAMRLLVGTDMTIQQITDALGFRYVHRLNDLFRRLAKTTPKAYRAQFRRRG